MFNHIAKVNSCLMLLLVLCSVSFAFGQYNSGSYNWDFKNGCYLSFNPSPTFGDNPTIGVSYDNSLVGYWSMNEGSGSLIYDCSGKGLNGSVNGASRVIGKFSNALSFNASNGDSVLLPSSSSLVFGNGSFTLMAWVKITNFDLGDRVTVIGGLSALAPAMTIMQNGQLALFQMGQNSQSSRLVVPLNSWTFLVISVDRIHGTVTYCVGDQFEIQMLSSGFVSFSGKIDGIGTYLNISTRFMNGVIDEPRIYNRALSEKEILKLHLQPDSASLAEYHNYKDSTSDNNMLVYIERTNKSSNDTIVVTCTNFFVNNRLIFNASNSATANVWTNLGQPTFATGVWNSQNYTTTLALNSSSVAELNWNTYKITTCVDDHSSVMPPNVTVGYMGTQKFNFIGSQGYRFNVVVDGVSQGQVSSYTFSNVTAPHTVNVTSTKVFAINASGDGNGSIFPTGPFTVDIGQTQTFNFTANAGYNISKVLVDNVSQSIADSYTFNNVQKNHTLSVSFALNTYNIIAKSDAHSTITPENASVTHGENQQFNIATDSGYVSRVFIDGAEKGNLTSYTFADVQGNHTIAVTSTLIGTETPRTSASPTSSPSASQPPQASASPSQTNQPSSTPQANQAASFPIQTALVAAGVIAVVVAVCVLAFKKGYITIEMVNEEDPVVEEGKSEGKSDDYAI